jgi:hypothetical protein
VGRDQRAKHRFVVEDVEIRATDGSDTELVEAGGDSCDVRLAAGPQEHQVIRWPFRSRHRLDVIYCGVVEVGVTLALGNDDGCVE